MTHETEAFGHIVRDEERARQEKADRLALEQVGKLASRMHRQLFLQLHHVMDEVPRQL